MKTKLIVFLTLALTAVGLTVSINNSMNSAAANRAFAPVTAVPLYRFYQFNYGFHFYTADPDERAALKTQPEWTEEQPEGWVFRQPMPGTVKLYRLLRVGDNGGIKHLFTIDPYEKDSAIAAGWKDEGVACWVSQTQVADTVPLHRLYFTITTKDCPEETWLDKLPLGAGAPFCNGTSDDDWFYTKDGVAKFKAIYAGYQLVRTEAYVWTKPVTLDASTTPAAPAPIPESYYTDQLFNLGCKKVSGGITCPSAQGYFDCESYRKGGKIKAAACTIANFDVAGFSKIEANLVSLGCVRFLGRVGEYNCESWAGGEACETTFKTSMGLITKCYTPRMRLVLSYQNSFGREPTAKEIALWKGGSKQNYTYWMQMHSIYLKTDAADNERKALVNRNYFEVQGRLATMDELNYWRDKIAKEGTSYAEMRKANIVWILRDDHEALLREIIKRAYVTAGSGKPDEAKIQEWVDKARAQKLTFKQIVAKLKTKFPLGSK